MRGTKVLISGASIAGPALAFWLHRFGADVTVVERAPSPRPGGQAVDIRGVARRAVELMGLEPSVRAACTETGGLSFVDRYGRTLSTQTADSYGGDGLIAEYEILRGDLAEVFLTATRDDVNYVFGDRITALDERDDGVHVTFERGEEERFDVVIGADGLHSGVRALVFGEESRFLRHLGMYLSFWSAENTFGLENWAIGYDEPGRGAGLRTIHDNTQVMVYLSYRSAAVEYDYRDIERQKDLVRAGAAGMAWQTPNLIARLDEASDFFFDSCSQVVLESWSKGRIGLLGDAAFCASPISGQGTSLAIVGAYILAGELAAAEGDHAAGLRAYEHRMRAWVDLTQRFGRSNLKLMQPMTKAGIWLRNQLMRVLPLLPGKLLMSGNLRKVFNGIELPDYRHLLVGSQGP
ncbi:FAD-dependent monooxygenase [Amycolatopsis samaneae]|uniref:FAD-dependent monooxygenase n=1 Tax=Amycolatopsis samaneae TaxID=664691 RepID=A0ABW5GJE1_9PSEU